MRRMMPGLFVIGLSITLSAQGGAGYSATTKSNWNEIKRNISESATLMPESGYAFRPTPAVRTFAQILGHLANEHYEMCSQAMSKANAQERVDFEKTTGKSALVKALNESIAYCDTAYSGLEDDPASIAAFNVLISNVVHDSEHYGNLVTYLRMNKLVPPSTARFSR